MIFNQTRTLISAVWMLRQRKQNIFSENLRQVNQIILHFQGIVPFQ